MKYPMGRKLIASLCAAAVVASIASGLSASIAYAMDSSSQGSAVSVSGSNSATAVCPVTVTVTGLASQAVPATVAQINLYMNVMATSVHQVYVEEQHFRTTFPKLLARLGIPKTAFTMTTNESSNGNSGPSGQFNLVVTLPNGKHLSTIITALSSAMPTYATDNVSVQYYPQDLVSVRQQVLTAALADARAQAGLLAADVGDTVGSVVSMSTTTPNYYGVVTLPNGSTIGGSQFTMTGTNLDNVSAQVTVTYQLDPPAAS